ncbi:hypothetical protein CWE12_00775 [Aliidiomarina sedimenti]|uniref:Outer membrane protein beta-barrel domain-containing protein n=1 Tax=Aliidiomarina sedimenti TaxID=1933879 RepID=A0ABY0C120_9GAMM|nr:porin family protein [Aliidiomarina sedimenti]RUO31566.1 hypothetical protein CWE12_00775 [Aliidiomarina sedimenti]
MLKLTLGLTPMIIASAFFSSAVNAQAQEPGWMLSAHIANSSIDTTERWQDGGYVIIDDDGTNWGLGLNYRLWPGLSLRTTYERGSGYNSAGQPSCPDICTPQTRLHSGSLNHYSITAIPEFAFTTNLIGFASFGVARTEIETHADLPDYSETDLTYGLGVGYQVTPSIFVSTEYQTTGSEYASLRVSVGYRF